MMCLDRMLVRDMTSRSVDEALLAMVILKTGHLFNAFICLLSSAITSLLHKSIQVLKLYLAVTTREA